MRPSNQRLTIEFVREKFEEGGCKLISEKYKNARTPLKYECECGNIAYIRYDNFRKGKRCNKCRYKKIAEKRKHSYEYVRRYFEDQGCTLLSDEYKNTQQKLDYICECGRKSSIRFANFQNGQRCRPCGIKKISGENSPHYKEELTEEDRLIGRNDVQTREWRKKVFERDDYTCYKCNKRGNGNLNAHHINAYNVFPELRYDVTNGLTLCEPCHREFHNQYGYGFNTEEQLEEWLNP